MLHTLNNRRYELNSRASQSARSFTTFHVMAARGRRFTAERAAEIIANWSSDDNDDEIDDGLSDDADADAEPVLEDESDESNDEYATEERNNCLLYTSPSPRDLSTSRMPSSA